MKTTRFPSWLPARGLFQAAACGLMAVLLAAPAQAQNPLPPDAQPTCVVTKQQFSKWFLFDTITKNGFVKPADSLAFAHETFCDFYQWSAQMFLWLNSPASGSGGRVFDSPVFYDVSSADAQGNRTFIPNTPGRLRSFAVRDAQVGPHGKRIKVSANGTMTEVEEGQAGGGGVLLTQNTSLVYYAIQVNDVYAYFLTGAKNNAFNPAPTNFPTTTNQAVQIEAYALRNGHLILDPKALTIELKTSWVDIKSVSDPADYVTIQATIPTYDFSKPSPWAPTGVTNATLALVGMHIAGSANSHPEMIWATFEHQNNAPNNSYTYFNTLGQSTNVALDTSGSWTFCANGATGTYNKETIHVSTNPATPTVLVAKLPGGSAYPTNIIRSFAWGGPDTSAATTTNNTEIIALNNAVQQLLPNGDVRKNYILIGALWTQGGVLPPAGTSLGSTALANATMETFHQVAGFNCFTCHNGPAFANEGLSHIYYNLQPLKTK